MALKMTGALTLLLAVVVAIITVDVKQKNQKVAALGKVVKEKQLLLVMRTRNLLDRVEGGEADNPTYSPKRQMEDLNSIQAVLKSGLVTSEDLGHSSETAWVGDLRNEIKVRAAVADYYRLCEMAKPSGEVKEVKVNVDEARELRINVHRYLPMFKANIDYPQISYRDVDRLLTQIERSAKAKITVPQE